MFNGIKKTAVSDGSLRMPALGTIPDGWGITTSATDIYKTYAYFWYTGIPEGYSNYDVITAFIFARVSQTIKDNVPIQTGAFPINFGNNRISAVGTSNIPYSTAPDIGNGWKFIMSQIIFPTVMSSYKIQITGLTRLTNYDVQFVIVTPSNTYMKANPNDNLITIPANGFSNIVTFKTAF